MMRPIGYFVHHQGRGHAERCAAIANALPRARPLQIFCARDNIFPNMPPSTQIMKIPSLFEPSGTEAMGLRHVPTPATLHCAPLGWSGIRSAMATIANWFEAADPVLMICDVSAEIAQLARICSVPHVKVLQHGERGDPGHAAAYDGAVGLLAPFHCSLAQPEWSDTMRTKTFFAGGLGVDVHPVDRGAARRRIGVSADERLVLVMSGGGGRGFSLAPIGVGARTLHDHRWITIGTIDGDWHATEPGNIEHRGWVDNAADYIAAADLIIASTGNTTCQQILAAGRPWLAVPEWRYFDEQHRKADALDAAGVATIRPHLPSSAAQWRDAVAATIAGHDPCRQQSLIDVDPAAATAAWLEELIDRLWTTPSDNIIEQRAIVP